MKIQKYYVRHLTGWKANTDPVETYDRWEIYTQPRSDYLRARAYHVWCKVVWKSRIETLQDRLWIWWLEITGNEEKYIDFQELPPGVRRDLKCYDLDVKNQQIVGDATRPKGDTNG